MKTFCSKKLRQPTFLFIGLLTIVVVNAIVCIAAYGRNEHSGLTTVPVQNVFFNPSEQKPLVYCDNKFTLKVLKAAEKLSIEIEEQGERSTIAVPQEMVQIDEIRRIQGKAIVLGMVNGSVSEILLIDLTKRLVLDQFYGYNPSISPDGRFITFTKFYPPHFSDETSDINVIYDTSKTPLENRLGKDVTDKINLGVLTYPLSAKKSTPEHHFISQDFSWSPDSQSYIFADSYAEGTYLIMVTLLPRREPVIRTFNVSEEKLCASISKVRCQMTLAGAKFIPGGILAQFFGAGVDASLDETLSLSYDEFSSIQ